MLSTPSLLLFSTTVYAFIATQSGVRGLRCVDWGSQVIHCSLRSRKSQVVASFPSSGESRSRGGWSHTQENFEMHPPQDRRKRSHGQHDVFAA